MGVGAERRIDAVEAMRAFGRLDEDRVLVDPDRPAGAVDGADAEALQLFPILLAKRHRLVGRDEGDIRRIAAQEQGLGDAVAVARTEEHTSELQSLMRISYAVFCL